MLRLVQYTSAGKLTIDEENKAITFMALSEDPPRSKLIPVNPDAFAEVTRSANSSFSRLSSLSHAPHTHSLRASRILYQPMCLLVSPSSSAHVSPCTFDHLERHCLSRGSCAVGQLAPLDTMMRWALFTILLPAPRKS